MILPVCRKFKALCSFLKDKYFVEMRFIGISPRDKTIAEVRCYQCIVNVHKNRRRYKVS